MENDISSGNKISLKLIGTIEDGKNDATHWLEKFNKQYQKKLGQEIYPGSLNIKIEDPFHFREKTFADKLLFMDRSEYGGERDILMIPCSIFDKPAFLWRTTRAEDGEVDGLDYSLIEVITSVHLRSTYDLNTGQKVEVDL